MYRNRRPMGKMAILILMLAIVSGCGNQSKQEMLKPTRIVKVEDIVIPVHNFNSMEPLLNRDNDTTYIINFWATWCMPCVKELPYFEEINEEFDGKPVKVVLISIDMPSQVQERLVPYLKLKNIKSKVLLLDDPDMNAWIPKVDKDWEGAIPATVIYKGQKRFFKSGEMTKNELVEQINSHLNEKNND